MKVNKSYNSREYTNTLYDLMLSGEIDPMQLANDLLCWMSEDEVKDFAIREDYLEED